MCKDNWALLNEIYNDNNNSLLQTHGPYHRHDQTTQEHKKWLSIVPHRIGACTWPTLVGAKHFNSTPTVTSFTHHNTGNQYWGRNVGIISSNFEIKK